MARRMKIRNVQRANGRARNDVEQESVTLRVRNQEQP